MVEAREGTSGLGPATELEDLLVEALDRLAERGPLGLEHFVVAHPEREEELRIHLARLAALGLTPAVEDPSGAGVGRWGDMPERLGEFRLLARLGSGGMGVVYLAEQEGLGRRVALKLVRAEDRFLPGARARFEREVAAIARLKHPSIVPVHAAGEEGGVPWLAMDYVEGVSLDQVLEALAERDPALLRGADLSKVLRARLEARPASLRTLAAPGEIAPSPEAALPPHFEGRWWEVCTRIAAELADALNHAHARGVLHRDVKPSNAMLTPDGRALLLDFGLARSAGAAKLTGTGAQLGSPAYMSPEQVRGDAELDERTDLYSLGVTLYELLTLRAAFASDSSEETRRRVIAGRARPLRAVNRAVPRDLEIVCAKAMDPEPARRYPDMGAFARDLSNVLARRPIEARPTSAWVGLRRAAQRHPVRATLLGAATLFAAALPAVVLVQQQRANARIGAALVAARASRDRALEAIEVLLTRVADEELFDLPRMRPVRRELLREARGFYERFLAEERGDPELQRAAADAALRIALLEAEFGAGEEALRGTEQALALARELCAARPDDPRALALLAEALGVRSAQLHTRGRYEEGLVLLDEAIPLARRVLSLAPDDLATAADLLGYERSRAFHCEQLGREEDVAAAYAAVASLWRDLAPRVRGRSAFDVAFRNAICTCADEAQHHARGGRVLEAQAALTRSEELAREVETSALGDAAALAFVRLELARKELARAAQDFAAVERHLRRALELVQPVLLRAPELETARRTHAFVLNDLGVLLTRQIDRAEEGLAVLRESIAELRRLIALDPAVVEPRGNLATSLINLGNALREQKHHAEARECFAEAVELARTIRAEVPTQPQWGEVLFSGTWFLSLVNGDLRDHTAQAEVAEALAALRPADPRAQRIAAGLVATAARLASGDEGLAEGERAARAAALDTRAFEHLRDAAAKGCVDAKWVKTAPELEVVRARADFAPVLAEIEANAVRAAPIK